MKLNLQLNLQELYFQIVNAQNIFDTSSMTAIARCQPLEHENFSITDDILQIKENKRYVIQK